MNQSKLFPDMAVTRKKKDHGRIGGVDGKYSSLSNLSCINWNAFTEKGQHLSFFWLW